MRVQNTTAPVGKVRGALEDQSIRLLGRLESPADAWRLERHFARLGDVEAGEAVQAPVSAEEAA